MGAAGDPHRGALLGHHRGAGPAGAPPRRWARSAAACAGRFGLAGLALGVACSIRPDAVLYRCRSAPIGAGVRPRPARAVRGSLAFVAGIAPLLAYNTITQGHPLAFTQGMEFRQLLRRRRGHRSRRRRDAPHRCRSSPAADSVCAICPQVLPQNLRYLAAAFGAVPRAGGRSARRGRCAGARWSRPRSRPISSARSFLQLLGPRDPRYLVGAALALLIAAAIGTTAWCAALVAHASRRGHGPRCSALGRRSWWPRHRWCSPSSRSAGRSRSRRRGRAGSPAWRCAHGHRLPRRPRVARTVRPGARLRGGRRDADRARQRCARPLPGAAGGAGARSDRGAGPGRSRGDHDAGARPAGGEHHALHARRRVLRGRARGSGDDAPAATRSLLAAGRRVFLLLPGRRAGRRCRRTR